MRFFVTLFAVVSLVTPIALARPSRIHNRKSVSADIPVTGSTKTLRQYHIPRALLDTCLYIDADVVAASGLANIPLDLLSDLDVCLCLSALPLALESNTKLNLLTTLLGKDAVSALLTQLVRYICLRVTVN